MPIREMRSEVFREFIPFADWHEDHGDVVWWKFPVCEHPYIGSPLDLGRGVHVTLNIGVEEHGPIRIGDTGGWPFDAADEPMLFYERITAPSEKIHKMVRGEYEADSEYVAEDVQRA